MKKQNSGIIEKALFLTNSSKSKLLISPIRIIALGNTEKSFLKKFFIFEILFLEISCNINHIEISTFSFLFISIFFISFDHLNTFVASQVKNFFSVFIFLSFFLASLTAILDISEANIFALGNFLDAWSK